MELPLHWGHLHLNGEVRDAEVQRWCQRTKHESLRTALPTQLCCHIWNIHLEETRHLHFWSTDPPNTIQFLCRKPGLSPQHGFKLPLDLLLFKWQEANFRQKIFNSSKFSWNLFRATEGLSTGNYPLLSPKGIDGVWGTVMKRGISYFHAFFVGRM